MAMFNPLKWWSDYKLQQLQMKLDAQNKPFSVVAEALKAQTDLINSYFAMFRSTEIPTSTIVRDIDEYQQEQEREFRRSSGDNPQLNPAIHQSILNALKGNAQVDLENLL